MDGYDYQNNDAAEWPKFSDFTKADWIKGGSLERMMIIQQRENEIVFYVLRPSDFMVNNDCDNCVRRHSPTNLNCSFSQYLSTPFRPGVLYNFNTKDHIKGNWILDQTRSEWRETTVGIETWIKPQSQTP